MIKYCESISPYREISDNILWENTKYYLLLDESYVSDFENILASSAIGKYITWHKGNKVAELKISNRIGKIRILDREFDVRSSKFCRHTSGTEQIRRLVSDLDSVSKKISFTFDTGIFSSVSSDPEVVEHEFINRLNYLYHMFFEVDPASKVESAFHAIKVNPARIYVKIHERRPIWTLRKIDQSILKGLVQQGFTNQGDPPPDITSTNLVVSQLTHNSSENQFIRYFFEYVQQICLRVLTTVRDETGFVHAKAKKLSDYCAGILFDEFFEMVDLPQNLHMNSTVLLSREGYKQIFQYYMTSLFSIRHIYEDYKDSFSADLIDVATLYEIWCFYKIAFEVLGAEVVVTERTSTLKDGKISYSTTFANDTYAVSYNKTFSSTSSGSYSISLRPDISIYNKRDKKYFHFDAKYRVNSYVCESGEEYKVHKNDDVAKMHTYVDAIYESRSSIVIYPGDLFRFFNKARPPKIDTELEQVDSLYGVGVLPLVPGQDNEKFSAFFAKHF